MVEKGAPMAACTRISSPLALVSYELASWSVGGSS